ncbi:MAG: hypothetical protein QM677_06960 [Microbacterium sp.]
MMDSRQPRALGGDAGFRVADGLAVGLTPGRMRGRAFARPFHGMRVAAPSPDAGGELLTRCRQLTTVLGPAVVFSHATAARLWRMPLPARVSEQLHTLSIGTTAVRRPGVIGWARDAPGPPVFTGNGIRLTGPVDTWVALATMTAARGGALTREELVAVGDFVISGERLAYGRASPLATWAELAAAVSAHGSRRGARALAWALERVRSPVDSPAETRLRLGLIAAGLPEPRVQPAVETRAGTRHPDLGYLEQRVLLEYLGDVHRTDRDAWRKDLTRVQLFEDAGYRVIMVGADDISLAGLPALAARVRRALER